MRFTSWGTAADLILDVMRTRPRRGMRLLALLAALLGAAVLAVAGCGRTEGESVAAGADVVPAGVAIFVTIDTDFDSEQWENAEDLVERFPRGDLLGRFLARELEREGLDFERDVEPAVGPEVDFVALPPSPDDAEPAVAVLTQPRDPQKLDQLLERSDEDVVKEEIGDWTVIATSGEVLDAFRPLADGEGESLADSERFVDAMAPLEGDAIAKVYVNAEVAGRELEGAQVFPLTGICSVGGELVSAGAALRAEDDGVRLESTSTEEGGEELETYEARFLDELPAGTALYLSFNELARQFDETREQLRAQMPELDRELAEAERFLGVSLEEDVLPLLEGEGALAVYASALVPTVTLALEVEDEERAVATLDNIVARLGAQRPGLEARETEIAGVPAKEVRLEEMFALYYAAFDGKLVVTTTPTGIEGLRGDGMKLGDDEQFQDATEAAGMPDETAGFVYVDADESVGLLEGLAALQGENIPSDVRENLEPLGTAVLYGASDDVCFSGFLSID
jgi:uncharacterized protein DUF3352